MNVVYVGNFGPPYSTENDVRAAFESLGHTVTAIQEDQVATTGMGDMLRDLAPESDLLLWTGTWEAEHGPNYSPGAFPLPDALDVFHACAAREVPTATLHLDLFWGVARTDRKWWRHPMFHTAHVFTADGGHPTEWARMGVNHHWLRPAVRHSAAHPGVSRPDYQCDVAFVGSDGHGYHPEWSYRRELVNELTAICARNGWSFRNPGGAQGKIDRGEDMNDFYASARVTVGDSLCLDRERSRYWSDRAYEAPGRGGLLIMPMLHALDDDYDGHLPMYDWGNFGQLETIIGNFLSETGLAYDAREATHKIAVERHTYVNRVQEMLAVIG